mmetsp:Transcript_22338/g.63994  ORF Transcript_22338/g.63994 Transcript_22338/m.63994 type:complete len:522 (-) Transcript_22338:252-1817(-)
MSDVGLLLAGAGIGIFVTLVIVLVSASVYRLSSKQRVTSLEDTAGHGDGERPRVRSAWDPEKGECGAAKAPARVMSPGDFELTIRQLLSNDLAEGFKRVELAQQLELLEQKVASSLVGRARGDDEVKASSFGLREAAMSEDGETAEGTLNVTDQTRTPSSSDRSGDRSGSSMHDQPPLGAEETSSALRPAPPPPESVSPAPPSVGAEEASPLLFGPTDRQNELADPVEKCLIGIDQEVSLRQSFHTVRQVLYKRDTQTTALQRELREARQQLWLQTAEAKAAKERLLDVVSDPERVPLAQAEALDQLRAEVRDLSSRLADSREQEKNWSSIARRQRQYFLQTEHIGQEGAMILRRHPAGEVFIASAPITQPYEEEDREERGTGWNVGTSHCNPYQVDSWPFEPNVLAARASRQPGLEDCEEEPEDCDEDEDDDDQGFPRHMHQVGDSEDDIVSDASDEADDDAASLVPPDDVGAGPRKDDAVDAPQPAADSPPERLSATAGEASVPAPASQPEGPDSPRSM